MAKYNCTDSTNSAYGAGSYGACIEHPAGTPSTSSADASPPANSSTSTDGPVTDSRGSTNTGRGTTESSQATTDPGASEPGYVIDGGTIAGALLVFVGVALIIGVLVLLLLRRRRSSDDQ